MSLFNYLTLSLGLSTDIGMVLLSDRLLAFSREASGQINEIPLDVVLEVPPMPPKRLPDDVRDGLTTRVHLGEFQIAQPIFQRGEMLDHEAAVARFQEAISSVVTGRSRFVKPRVVCCIPWRRELIRKRAMLDAIEMAGARTVYLTETGIVTAMGLGLDVLGDQVHGVLHVESDWSVFAVVSYADMLAYRFIPIGSDDLPEPSPKNLWRDRLLDEIASALSELRPNQIQKLNSSGVCCSGYARAEPWAETMAELLNMPCHTKDTDDGHHPTAVGLRHYLDHLNEWKQTLRSHTDSI